jgi:hypothetical protein
MSGGIQPGRRVAYEFSALTDYAVDLSGVTGRPPRVCLVATAQFCLPRHRFRRSRQRM